MKNQIVSFINIYPKGYIYNSITIFNPTYSFRSIHLRFSLNEANVRFIIFTNLRPNETKYLNFLQLLFIGEPSFNKLLTRMQLFENDRCRTHHYRNQTANEIYPRVFVSAFSIVNLCSLLPFSGQRHPSPLPLVFLVIYRHSSFTFHVRVPVGTRRHDAS